MAYDLARLGSYVRFYLTVRTQLGSAWENLERTHGVVKEALAPFGEPLAPAEAAALTAALGASPTSPASIGRLDELWRPADEEALGELNDVYEIAGRFSFQGEDNKNLARVQALVSGARNEIVTQRGRAADLLRLPDQARAAATRLAAAESARAAAARVERTAAFEPLAEAVSARARQTLDATRAVAVPELAVAEAAADEYKRYAAKVDQVYQTCLPFLRKAIANLYASVGCEPTASWPDALPIERALPAELCSVPPADSPDLSQARQSLKNLADEERELGRARDDITTNAARLEGELAAAAMKDREIELEIGTTSGILDYLAALEQAEAARQTLPLLEQQKAMRVQAAGEVWQRHRKIEAAIKLLEEELVARATEATGVEERLVAERKDEPVLFGKDDWRRRVAAVEAEIDGRRLAYAERQAGLNQLKIELSAVSVEVQTVDAQTSLVDRQLTEMQARLGVLQKLARELGGALGASRPAHPVPLAEGQQALGMLQQGRVELAQRSERLKAESRRQKEDTVRVLTRLKQIGVERQQTQAMLENAEVAATQGREAALKQLALQRRAAVERHVSEVLGTLEKSLTLAGQVFVDPARQAMLLATEPKGEIVAAVRAAAEAVAPVVEKLQRELDPELLAADATLGQIQREFCDVALSACKSAWA